MKEPSLHPKDIHAQEYAPWFYFSFLVSKEECLRACSHPPGPSPPSKCGEGWSWREGGERLCVLLLPPAPPLRGGGGQVSTGTRGVRWSAWLRWREAAGSWTPGSLTSPSSPTALGSSPLSTLRVGSSVTGPAVPLAPPSQPRSPLQTGRRGHQTYPSPWTPGDPWTCSTQFLILIFLRLKLYLHHGFQ